MRQELRHHTNESDVPALLRQLRAAISESSLSSRSLASVAGLSPSTVHRALLPSRDVSSLTVAKLGLAVGLRLELAPLRSERVRHRRSCPPLPTAQVPPLAATAEHLLGLAGAELRHARRSVGRTSGDLAADLDLAPESVLRAERGRAPWPMLRNLAEQALHVGATLAWVPVDAPWRERPWQRVAVAGSRPKRGTSAHGSRAAMFTSLDQTWRTPPNLFEALSRELGGFTLDAAALETSALCAAWLGPDHRDPRRRDALRFPDWADPALHASGELRVWLNPPYSAGLGAWTSRAAATAKNGVPVVALVPARTDTNWWHEDVLEREAEFRFVRGRLTFGGATNGAPFPSVVVIWR